MDLGSSHPLTKMSTRIISGGGGVKAAVVWDWQPYHLYVPIVLKSMSLNLLKPSGPVQACNGMALPFTCFVAYKNQNWIGQINFVISYVIPPKF